MKKVLKYVGIVLMFCAMLLSGCIDNPKENIITQNEPYITLETIPEYSGDAYIAIENNIPSFEEKEKITTSFEKYSDLDILGRCGTAFANVGKDLMPTEKRGSIGQVKPSGWQTVKYDHVDGKYLYNRCHLIGYQLTAENANEMNLITGTRYLNIEGMLPFENMVADYVKETGHHVLYRVTPIFEGSNLVASGVHIEGYSVEDEGEGISFNVYAYNVQPGVVINYANGESTLDEKINQAPMNEREEIRGNSTSKIYHCPGQASYDKMRDSKNLVVFGSEEEAIVAGYRKAKK